MSPSSSISPSASASPSSGGPTANYDIQLLDQNNFDLLNGLGMNRSSNASEHAILIHASTSLHPVVDETDTLTLVITGNTVANATIAVDLYYALGY